MNQHQPTREAHETSPELRDIAQQVDGLASSERAAAGSGFESRIHAATVGSLTPPPLHYHEAEIASPAMPMLRRISVPLRIAAVIALCSTVGLGYLAFRGGLRSQSIVIATDNGAVISDIEHWLAVSATDDAVDAVNAELDLLKADTQSLSEGIRATEFPEGGAL